MEIWTGELTTSNPKFAILKPMIGQLELSFVVVANQQAPNLN